MSFPKPQCPLPVLKPFLSRTLHDIDTNSSHYPIVPRHASPLASGLIGGLLLCVVVGTVEALTLYVLSKFAERYSAVTYVELVRRALGRKLAALLSVMLVVAMFGACIAYQVGG